MGKKLTKPTDDRRGASRSRSRRRKWLRVPKFLTASISLLLLPFRILANSLDHWRPFAFLAGLWRRIWSFVKWLIWGTARPIKAGSRRENQLSWPSRKVWTNPASWCRWLISFVARWALSRPVRSLVLALPGLMILGGVFAVVSLGNRKFATQALGRYSLHLVNAIERKDTQTARLVADALVQLFPDEVDHRLRRALIEYELGDKVLARVLMTDLATSGGSSVAALWLANNVGGAGDLRTWPKEKLQEYVDWLIQAASNAPQDPTPRVVLADVLVAYGDLQRARAVLLPLAQSNLEIADRVVQLEVQTGQRELARKRAEPLVRALQPYLSKQPENLKLRIRCADLFNILNQTNEAVSILRDGIVFASTDEQRDLLERALVEALVLDAASIGRMTKSPPNMMRRFRQLKVAAGLRPGDPNLQQAIAEACLDTADSQDLEVMQTRKEFLESLPANAVRFVEGTAALKRGEVAQAKQLLNTDADTNAASPGQLNNLAHAILQEDEPDLQRALSLSDAAVKGLPQHPYLRETRGQILFRMQRYEEAIPELEYALLATELRAGVRLNLALAYEATGHTEEARMQRELHAAETATTP